ncbi:LamG-like jellyroll fold domain-containing protein [Actinoplanes sp. NPDC023936]|uniref:LamG-like jellyroll fold domain-containing protein n=1 Tax=Actinoplanes sp. NPDC023936 TaxID=3154910 RepID=UPI0033E31A65
MEIRRRFGVVAVAVAATVAMVGAAAAVRLSTTERPAPLPAAVAAPDPDGVAHRTEQIRAMSWNICGEAGGLRGYGGYCAWRNRPQARALQIESLIRQRDLNVVLLQEVCFPHPNPTDGTRGAYTTHLQYLLEALGPGWSAKTVVGRGFTDKGVEYELTCRGDLDGYLGDAILVRGEITSSVAGELYVPATLATKVATPNVLCVRVNGWQSTPCVTHLNTVATLATATTAGLAEHRNQVQSLVDFLTAQEPAGYDNVVLGGDFNPDRGNSGPTHPTAIPSMAPLYDKYAECDYQQYLPGFETSTTEPRTALDPSNEDTHFSTQSGAVKPAKRDYLFAEAGFTRCDSLTELADQTENLWGAADPAAFSDHAPLVGSTRGTGLAWPLDEGTGTTTAEATGYATTSEVPFVTRLNRGATWSTEGGVTHLKLDGTGYLNLRKASGIDAHVVPTSVMDTRGSFTVSVWAKVDAGAPAGTVVRQESLGPDTTNGIAVSNAFALAYNGSGGWSFAMANPEVRASHDTVTAPAQAGTWTHLAASYDAMAGKMSLSVNGAKAVEGAHTKRVVGALVLMGDGFKGALNEVRYFPYVLNGTEQATLRAPRMATRLDTIPRSDYTGGPYCNTGGYSTITTLTPQLSAFVESPQPGAQVRATFGMWNNSVAGQPAPLVLRSAGSFGSTVTGSGMSTIQTPKLTPDTKYGWRAQVFDGTLYGLITKNCYVYTAKTAQ